MEKKVYEQTHPVYEHKVWCWNYIMFVTTDISTALLTPFPLNCHVLKLTPFQLTPSRVQGLKIWSQVLIGGEASGGLDFNEVWLFW